MKATFTLATPRPGEVVSGVEIEVDGIVTYYDLFGITRIDKGNWVIVAVKESPEQVRQIIEATKAKNSKPFSAKDESPKPDQNG